MWRYEIDDMARIFSDFEVVSLKNDHEVPGVFLKAKKHANWKSRPLMRLNFIQWF